MKKLFPLFLILVLGFSACNQNGEGKQYVGSYSGTFTFITNNTTKQGTVKITQNPLVEDGILLYYVFPMAFQTGSTFSATSVDSELMTSLLTSIIGDNAVNTAEETIKNMNVKAVFSGSSLSLTVSYTVEILSTLNTEVRIIEFVGTKE